MVFNRVPKAGTEMITSLLENLSKTNRFGYYRHYSAGRKENIILRPDEEVSQITGSAEGPEIHLFTRHYVSI